MWCQRPAMRPMFKLFLQNSRIVRSSKAVCDIQSAGDGSNNSYRKKFVKLKVQFELKMRESENLVRERLRIEDLSKTIQETNE